MRTALLLLCTAAIAFPQSEPGHGDWGGQAINLTAGTSMLSHNESTLFVPASNAKLFTAALALKKLGPDHRFITRIAATAAPDAQGVLRGDLHFIGGGDTSLSGRILPFKEGAVAGNPLGPLNELADQVVKAGIRRITGDIVGDDTFFVHDPYPVGWQVDDALNENGPAVSALTLHDNVVRIAVSAGAVTFTPATAYFSVSYDTSAGPLSIQRALHSRHLVIRGSGNGVLYTSIDDPAHYAAFMLREALTARGVQIDGGIKVRHRYDSAMPSSPATVEIARRLSMPLIELLRLMVKVSQNLHAEMILRAAATEPNALAKLCEEANIDKSEIGLRDGSGLSRMSIVSPSAFVKLLTYMEAGPEGDLWMSLFPIGGEDGTLSNRFKGLSQVRVSAKTGTMTHTGALSGYLDTPRGHHIAFSVIVNNSSSNAAAVRAFIDRIVVSLAE